jgi:F-type H+/Na+-transporting ATPase subunit alpha
VDRVSEFEMGLLRFLSSDHPDLEKEINEKQQLTPETEKQLVAAIEKFKEGFAG